jgi:hypothetical protein
MIDLYVYYKVRTEDAAALLPQVTAMQAGLSAAHGVSGRLKRRAETCAGLQTWMEVYPDVTSEFEAILGRAAQDAGLAALAGARHTEVFMDMLTCA